METDVITREPERSLQALAATFTIAFAVGLFVLHLFKFPLDATFLDSHVRVLRLESSRAQVAFYLTMLCLLATACAALLLSPNAKIILSVRGADQILAISVVIAAIVLGSWARSFLSGFLSVAALLICSRASWLGRPSSAWKWLSLMSSQRFGGVLSWFFIGIVFVYFTIFLVFPFTTPLLITGASESVWVESHYALTVLPGFDLVCCPTVGMIERSNYGPALPLLTAFALKALPLAGIPDTTLVQAVKMFQIVAAAIICVLSFLVNRKASPYVMALALGMTAFMLGNATSAIGYPNQTGIRYVIFLVSILVLVLETRRAQSRIWLLASASALFVLMSPETGVAATAGYVVAAVLKGYISTSPIASIARTLTRFGAVFATTTVVGLFLIVGPILKAPSGGGLQFLTLFAGGYGGLVDNPNMAAILLFFFATTAVLRGVWRARERTLSWADVHEAAVGTMLLVWLTYYVNRMAEWNLWFDFVLLVLMIAPRLTLEGWQLMVREPLRPGLTQPMIIACLIVGQLVHSSSQLARDVAGHWRLDRSDGVISDGMCLRGTYGREFTSKFAVLTEKYSPTEALVLSGSPTHVRLLGFNKGFPWHEPFGEIVREKDVDALVNWIEKQGPNQVLADDPASVIAQAAPERNRHIQSMLARLISYRESGSDGGWVVLERVIKTPHRGE